MISGTGSKEEGEGGLLEERRMYCTLYCTRNADKFSK